MQIDFIDGEFAANRTIKPTECDLIPYLPLRFDAHLMVTENNVLEWSKAAEKMGFERVIPQLENISRPEEFSALALDLETSVEKIEPYLGNLDLVLVMSVKAGFGGQEFDEVVYEKIRALKKRGVRICVDGGVDQEHLPILENLGVDEVAVGAKRVLSWK